MVGEETNITQHENVMFALANCHPKKPIAKSGELVRCMVPIYIIGKQVYGRYLKVGDVIRIKEDCLNPIAYERIQDDYTGTVYEPLG